MSYLGTILELDDGSRLTGVGLRPLARELSYRDGTVYLHVVMLPAETTQPPPAVQPRPSCRRHLRRSTGTSLTAARGSRRSNSLQTTATLCGLSKQQTLRFSAP